MSVQPTAAADAPPTPATRGSKRLLHVVRSFAPGAGGPTEGIKKLAQTYAPVRATGDASASAAAPAMELVCLDEPDAAFVHDSAFPVHALGPAQGHYGYTPKLEHWLRANLARFDGVVIHGLWQHHSYGTYCCVRGRAPYAVFPHGMLDPYFKHAFPLKHLKKQLYWLARENRVLRDARAVCFTTSVERDCAAETFWPHRWRSAVVSFGTSAPEGDPAAQRTAFIAAFPQLAGRRFFLFLSRLHVKKGCDLAIQAFARVARAHPELDLVMAGPDAEGLQPQLAALAEGLKVADRVHWTGMLQGDLKWGAFYAAEAFLLPSHQENFGVAVVEAMACRLPVLISNQVNIWPEIKQDAAGIVDDDTLEGTYRSMQTFLSMPEDARLTMVENGRRCFRARFQMERTAKALEELFSTDAQS